MIGFLIWILVGAIIGWIATELMHDRSNLLINIIVGIVGAFIAGYLLTPLFHISTINQGAYSIPALLVSLGGAIILLFVVNLIRGRGRR
ncbi:MAG: GlsB/YeaQ/YmgE family stress response membrane protein [Anaerolineales bacterium]|jgi:uncharacterized membrane protein YeaQ/YmgE (transglycosylase-associated protein family)